MLIGAWKEVALQPTHRKTLVGSCLAPGTVKEVALQHRPAQCGEDRRLEGMMLLAKFRQLN